MGVQRVAGREGEGGGSIPSRGTNLGDWCGDEIPSGGAK